MGYEFFGEKIIFPSAPVPGINNDQSLTQQHEKNGLRVERLLNCHQEKITSWIHREAHDIHVYRSFLKVATHRLSNW